MAIPIKDDFANARAIEMYQWVLSQKEPFKSMDIPGYTRSRMNQLAIKMLVDRDLIRVVRFDLPRTYRLSRSVDLATCLDVPSTGNYSGVVRYRVDPSIAAQMPTASNLRQYSI